MGGALQTTKETNFEMRISRAIIVDQSSSLTRVAYETCFFFVVEEPKIFIFNRKKLSA